MRNSSVLVYLEKVRNAIGDPVYPVDGFSFILDDPNSEPQEVFPLEDGMPSCQGFVYNLNGKLYSDEPQSVFDAVIIDEDVIALLPGDL